MKSRMDNYGNQKQKTHVFVAHCNSLNKLSQCSRPTAKHLFYAIVSFTAIWLGGVLINSQYSTQLVIDVIPSTAAQRTGETKEVKFLSNRARSFADQKASG